jgi:APA family basic amino acid/polyamine antiporter
LLAATGMVVGGTIGVGIFLTPAGMAKAAGSPGLLLAVWLFLSAMAVAGALCFGELAARFPEAGGAYVYLRAAFGPGVAFLYGWKCLLVMDPGLTAALATGLGSYAAALVPGLPPKVAAMAGIAAVAAANLRGVRLAAALANGLAVAKVAVLLGLVAFGFLSGRGDLGLFEPFLDRRAGSPPLVEGLAAAVVAGFFSFGGWWEAGKLAGEVHDAPRTMPRALVGGVLVVALLYVAVSAVFLQLVPLPAIASSEAFAAQAGAALFGPAGATVLSGIVLLSVLGSLFSFMTMSPRLYYAMARTGAAPAWIGALNAEGVPARAVVLQAALALLLVAVGTFEAIVAYFIFVTVLFLGIAVAALFRFRRESAARPAVLAPLFPVPALVFLASVGVVLALVLAGRPLQSALGVAVVALGWPLYRWRRRQELRDAA